MVSPAWAQLQYLSSMRTEHEGKTFLMNKTWFDLDTKPIDNSNLNIEHRAYLLDDYNGWSWLVGDCCRRWVVVNNSIVMFVLTIFRTRLGWPTPLLGHAAVVAVTMVMTGLQPVEPWAASKFQGQLRCDSMMRGYIGTVYGGIVQKHSS